MTAKRCPKCDHLVHESVWDDHACEYLRRNLLVCKAVGAQAAALKILERMHGWQRAPKWLEKSVRDILERVTPLPHELAAYRDQTR